MYEVETSERFMPVLISIDASSSWPWASVTDTRSSSTALATTLHTLEGFMYNAFEGRLLSLSRTG